MQPVQKIEISHRTIIFTIASLLLLWIIYQIRTVIVLVFISIIFMSALNPGVDYLEKNKIPRFVSIFIFYILIIGFFSAVVATLIPPLVDQTAKLIDVTPKLLTQLEIFNLKPDLIVDQLTSLPSNIFRFALNAVENIIVTFTIMVFTFYLLLERKNLKTHLTAAFGKDGQKRAEVFIDKLEKKLGRWVRGRLFSMAVVGFLTYAGLQLLGIEFALPLAILSGLLEIVTNIGPVIAAIPAVIIALATAPLIIAFGVVLVYFAIQQLEAQVITPKVMAHAIGFNPLVTIITLLAGFTLAGIGGAILALPLIIIVELSWETIYRNQQVI